MEEPPPIDYGRVADELQLQPSQVKRATELLDEGNTVPFITRYRKEQTGNLDEEQLRQVQERVGTLRQLAQRANTILRLIDAQGRLTDKLRAAIQGAETLKRLEDLYLPYRPKRRSRAMLARERGLEPLAERIWSQDPSLTDIAQAAMDFVDPDQELPTSADVLRGAADILAERVGENADVRSRARKIVWQSGSFKVTAAKKAPENAHEFQDYFNYSEAVSRIPPHRLLALNRGEKAGALKVKLEWDQTQAHTTACALLRIEKHRFREYLERCVADALQRLVEPSLDRELRRELTERAERHAVSVFARNLKSLLLQPPLSGRRILAIDPGFRTGCKVAVLDERGNCLAVDVVYVTGSEEKRLANIERLGDLARLHRCDLFAIGNGTACRETEELISQMIARHNSDVRYIIVNEAGASIYSASPVAREEFPDLDATVRGTISIGRRLQDPLSELVKIDPQHIGVGLYQHDITPRLLRESLDRVIESCVNFVGVDLNTASASLLRHVSGFNQLIARRVVEWRDQYGPFRRRRQLMDVPGVGDATFTQAAGFLKIANGDEPLDGTWIHPESYEVTHKLLDRLAIRPEDLLDRSDASPAMPKKLPASDLESFAASLNVGLPTLQDIVDALSRPGRDPRTDLPGPLFKTGVLKLDDLQEGMELKGTVLNVVDFGAFVDMGLKDSGLVHISQMSSGYVRSPHEVVSVGDVVTVWVLGVDRERRRVSLTMVKPETSSPARVPQSPVETERRPQTPKPTKPQHAQPGGQTTSQPPQRRPKREPEPSPPDLTQEARDGRKPLRGFDELKELWKNR